MLSGLTHCKSVDVKLDKFALPPIDMLLEDGRLVFSDMLGVLKNIMSDICREKSRFSRRGKQFEKRNGCGREERN